MKKNGLVVKVVRTNTFLFFLIIGLIILYYITSRIGHTILFPILDKTIGRLARCFVAGAKSIRCFAPKDDTGKYDNVPQFTYIFTQPRDV